MKFYGKLMAFNKWWYFFFLCVFVIVMNYISKTILFKNDFYYEILGEQMSYDRIKEIITTNNKYEWVGHVFTPFFYLLKFLMITVCFKIGLIFYDIKISWGKLLNWVIKLETIFLLPSIINIVWFSFISTDYNYQDIQFFYPFALINIFNPQEISQWFIYPLQVLNVFEIIYWYALIKLFTTETKHKFWKMFEFVFYTYGLSLLVWMVLIMFLSVNFS